jgi:hypothetical protein
MTKSFKIQLHKSFLEKQPWIDDILQPLESMRKPIPLFQHDVVFNFLSETLYSITDDKSIKLSEIRNIFHLYLLRTPFDPLTYILALLFFERIQKLETIEQGYTEKFFSICVLLSCKINEDVYLGNSKFFHFFEENFEDLKEFNQLEKNILQVLNYELYVSSEELKQFILSKCQCLSGKIQKGIQTTELNRKKIFQNKC